MRIIPIATGTLQLKLALVQSGVAYLLSHDPASPARLEARAELDFSSSTRELERERYSQ